MVPRDDQQATNDGSGSAETLAAAYAVLRCDRDGIVRACSRGAAVLLGHGAAAIVGRPFATLVAPERVAAGDLRRFDDELAARGAVQLLETEVMTSDDRRMRVTISAAELLDRAGARRGFACVLRDVDAMAALVRQLHDTEKLAALRAMASGVAHEIGNPLAGVLGILQLAERKTHDSDTRSRLATARVELLRVGRMIHELVDFTRADGEEGAIDVNAVLRSAAVFARYAYPASAVAVHLTLDGEVPALAGSRTHFLQACLHLVMNAYDAMGDVGGTLAIRSSRVGDAVRIEFADTGHGMTPDVRARLFEPFFTTKAVNAATGLGLFVCQRVMVGELGGTIAVESNVGAGARFTVVVPVRRVHRDRTRRGAGGLLPDAALQAPGSARDRREPRAALVAAERTSADESGACGVPPSGPC